MGKKLVAVFLLCLVVVAAVQFQSASADGEGVEYRACYDQCLTECANEGKGNTVCEMKCDTDCAAQEFQAELNKLE